MTAPLPRRRDDPEPPRPGKDVPYSWEADIRWSEWSRRETRRLDRALDRWLFGFGGSIVALLLAIMIGGAFT